MKLKKSIVLALSMTVALLAGSAFAGQPHMQKALDLLQHAKAQLQKAAHNKDGHRVQAIKEINAAIREVKLGIKAGNKNRKDKN